MLIDITLRVTPKMVKDINGTERKSFSGHIGTHFDVMDKVFPIEYTRRVGKVFDVTWVGERDIDICDIDTNEIESGMFVAFNTGWIEEFDYGTPEYAHGHPQLTHTLIDYLIEKKISLIGIDAPGIRRSHEHTPADQKCADNNIFVIENLTGLSQLCNKKAIINTYPMNFRDMSGLPCRVVAETEI